MIPRNLFLNILKFCYEYPPLGGGGGHVAAGLSDQLSRMGHRVDLVTMRYKGLKAIERKKGLTIHRVPCIRQNLLVCHPHEMLSYLCMALPKALQLLRRNPHDIIHAHFIFPDGLLAMLASKISGLPFIITSHGSDVPGFNPDRFVIWHKMLRPAWKMILSECNQLVCLSRYIEFLLKAAMPDANTVIIPNGFSVGRFRTSRFPKKIILVVTRMFKRKGVQHLLKAVEGMPIGDYEIHIVGDGPYLKDLKLQAESMNTSVRFHGYVPNDSDFFRDLMERAAIFVFPSESDNFPMVLLEAMDAGLAIITTRNTGCEEVVGNAALLTDPGDVVGLRDALRTFIENPSLRLKFSESARNRLDENFNWPVVAGRYVDIYRRVILKRGMN